MSDIVERLRNHADESLLDDYRIVCEKFNQPNMLLEAADEIERLRKQLSRHEWAESADRALMQEEIEHQRDEIERLRRERMAVDEALRQEIHHGTVRTQRHRRLDDAGAEQSSGDLPPVA